MTLNLIPWNPIYSPSIAFSAPAADAVKTFWRLLKDRGIHVTIRQEKGADISGAPAVMQLQLHTRSRQTVCCQQLR